MDTDAIWIDLVRYAVGGIAIVVAFRLLVWKRPDFVVKLQSGTICFEGKFPLARQGDMTEFLLCDLALQRPAKILAARRGKRLEVWFRGALSDGQKQRIRNFLLTHL